MTTKIILLTAISMFIGAFNFSPMIDGICDCIDISCILYFLWESLTQKTTKADKIVLILSLPFLASPWIDTTAFNIFLLLRLGRVLRLTKTLKIIPGIDRIWASVKKSLSVASGLIFMILCLNFLFAMAGNALYSEAHPELFGNPIQSMYTMFKVFTVEGWYTVADEIGGPVVKIFFTTAVIVGGLLGLSIANAVFVDAMLEDDNKRIEDKLDELKRLIERK